MAALAAAGPPGRGPLPARSRRAGDRLISSPRPHEPTPSQPPPSPPPQEKPRTPAEPLSEYVRPCFRGIGIKPFDPDAALAEVARLCRRQGWNLASWDIDRGL